MSTPASPATVPPASPGAAVSSSRAADESPSGHLEDAEPQVQPTLAVPSEPSPGLSSAAHNSQGAAPSGLAALSGSHAPEESLSGHFENAEPQVQPAAAVPSGVSEPSQGVSSASYDSRGDLPRVDIGRAQSTPPSAPPSEVSTEADSACQQQPGGVPAGPHAGTPMPDDQLPPELGTPSRPSSHPAHPTKQNSTSGDSTAELAAPLKWEGGAHVPAAAALPAAAAASATDLAAPAAEPEGEPHIREIVVLPVAEVPEEPDPQSESERAPSAPAAHKQAPPDADDGHQEAVSMEEECAPLPEPHAACDPIQTTEDIAGQPGASGGVVTGSRSDESSLGHKMSVDESALSENGHVSVVGERLDSNGDAASEVQSSSHAVLEADAAVPAVPALPRIQPTADAGSADTHSSAASGAAKEQASAPTVPEQELQAAAFNAPLPADRQSEEAAKPEEERLVEADPQPPAVGVTAASPTPAAAMPAASVVQPSAESSEAKSPRSDVASERQSPAAGQPARAVPETSLASPTSVPKPASQPQPRQAQPGPAPPTPSATSKSVAAASTVKPQATDPLQSLLGQSQPASQPAPAAPTSRLVRSPVQVTASYVLVLLPCHNTPPTPPEWLTLTRDGHIVQVVLLAISGLFLTQACRSRACLILSA